MIHEMDASIRSFLRAGAANGDDVEVAFDAPSNGWAAAHAAAQRVHGSEAQ